MGLEIGFGSGRFAQPLGAKIGIDPSRNMLKLAKKRSIQVILGTGENLPFKDLTFDFVLVIVTLCFVENPVSVMKEAGRVLKRGGRLIVGEINKDSWLGQFYVLLIADSVMAFHELIWNYWWIRNGTNIRPLNVAMVLSYYRIIIFCILNFIIVSTVLVILQLSLAFSHFYPGFQCMYPPI